MTTTEIILAVTTVISTVGAIITIVTNRKKLTAEARKTNVETNGFVASQYKGLYETVKQENEELRKTNNQYRIFYEEMERSKEIGSEKTLVFIIDDNPMVVMEFELYLENSFYLSHKTFTDVDQFIKAANKYKPDVLVLDNHLDGIKADEVIKKIDCCPKIVIMSADESVRQMANENGWTFFYKEKFYVLKVAKYIIDHFNS